ncbi:MAG: UDP-N-acetylglucosamine pyrophosphorylase [Clostridia bacterium]|nr:UDP-N-acetylglucosamine pyrophosphorylase [Clostridia bacterium]
MENNLCCSALFEKGHSVAESLIFSFEYPWEVLPHIGKFILEYGNTLPLDKYYSPAEGIWIAKSAKVSPTASISSPCIIGEDTEIRHCAFIRGNTIIGNGAVIGNSVELKNCIISDRCQVPHYNYVGDSILGYKSHMGAGSITSNVKSDKSPVSVKIQNGKIDTGLKKFGAILGDFVEVGCNSVLNPGTVIGSHSNVYPLSSVRGFVPGNSIFKGPNNIVIKK